MRVLWYVDKYGKKPLLKIIKQKHITKEQEKCKNKGTRFNIQTVQRDLTSLLRQTLPVITTVTLRTISAK